MENLRKCNRFSSCLINICPLDSDAGLRNKRSGENPCPFCLNKKSKGQKGMRTLAPRSVLEFIPESNIKMLNRRNQKLLAKIRNGKS
jgi:hypothetical protein